MPDEIVIPHSLEDQTVMAEWLADRKGRKVSIAVSRRGQGRGLLEMARRNAESVFRTERLQREDPEEALPALAERLALKNFPRRIECFDISNLGGSHAVGSMVVFLAGRPLKSGYRRFRIRTVAGADDYGMMYEVLSRRYRRKESLPDLIVVDGGKGQLGVALSVLKDLGIAGVDAIGLAKERPDEFHRGFGAAKGRAPGGAGFEKGRDRVYLPGRKDPLFLDRARKQALPFLPRAVGLITGEGSAAERDVLQVARSRWPAVRFLLARIRDEAHRFAVTYHRSVREKQDLRSLLDDIAGVGPAKKRALLMTFGDLDRVRAASAAELRKAPGIGEALAAQIHDFLRGKKD